MDVSEPQLELFRMIKTSVLDHLSITEEVAKVLNISVDSTYRRMRGEKILSLEELYALCSYYKISVDSVFNIQTGTIPFQSNSINRNELGYKEYIDELAKWVTYFNGFRKKKLYFTSRDIPFCYFFQFREFGAFKYYLRMKNIYRHPDFINRKFNFEDYPDDVFHAGQKFLALYNQLSVFEFWGTDIIAGTIRQIDYYKSSGMFHTNEDVFKIYDAFEKLLEHIKSQAVLGYKYEYSDPEKRPIAEYQLFYRDLFYGDDSMLFILDGMKLSFINHTAINYMVTRDMTFNENMHVYVNEMIQSSTRISSVGEWERSKFFHVLQERISRRKSEL